MRLLFRLFTLGLLCLFVGTASASSSSSSSANAASDSSHVKVIGSDNFDRLTAKGTWLVEFYAPWCGHCKRLAPTYEKVATALEGAVHVAKCDATVERGLAARFPVTGYPALYVINGTSVYAYDGARSKSAIEAFATTGWTKAEPLGFLQSPFSAIGRTKGILIAGGSLLLDLHEYLQLELGLSPVVAAVSEGIGVLTLMMVAMFFCLSYCSPQPTLPHARGGRRVRAGAGQPQMRAQPPRAAGAAPGGAAHAHQD